MHLVLTNSTQNHWPRAKAEMSRDAPHSWVSAASPDSAIQHVHQLSGDSTSSCQSYHEEQVLPKLATPHSIHPACFSLQSGFVYSAAKTASHAPTYACAMYAQFVQIACLL